MIKTIIIPDIHNDYHAAEKIIKKENPDKIVFLGDYFDDFYDTVKDAANVAKWLVKSLQQKNRIHLIGNHDLSYMTDNPNLKCTGYNIEKHTEIKKHNIDWSLLKMHYWLNDDWLCTHAGFSNDFFKQQCTEKLDSVQQILKLSKNDLEKIHDVKYNHAFFQVGFTRGGSNEVGGTLWCGYDEFVDVPGIHQIFGHTKGNSVRHSKTKDSEHYCIDTGLCHYAVYQNDKMKIKIEN